MEKSFTIEKIEDGYISEVGGVKKHFTKMGDLINYTFALADNLFKEKSKIKITFRIEEIDA